MRVLEREVLSIHTNKIPVWETRQMFVVESEPHCQEVGDG